MVDFSNSTVAVTGGAGFIGSHLVQRLRGLGASVIVIDKSLPFMPLEELIAGPPIRFHRFELGAGSRVDLREILQGAKTVFHLAAQKHNQLEHESGPNLNVRGTEQLLRAAKEVGAKKIVFTSSLYAYGRMFGPPMVETELPFPTTTYGISKLQCEHACHRMSVLSRIPTVVLRLFFAYGPRQSAAYPSVILRNFERMLKGDHPVIHGDGLQVFDYSYVDDVVDAILAASQYDQFGIFNVGTGLPLNIQNLIYHMQQVAGVDLAYETAPPDWTANTRRVADTAKFETQFGMLPRIGWPEGLWRTFEWMKSRA